MTKIVSLKRQEFSKVYSKGTSKANRYLILYVKEGGNGKLGISVSKKVGNSVVRHRVKRLIKEAYRLNRDFVRQDMDFVFIARPTASERSYADIESAVKHLFKLHKLRQSDIMDEDVEKK